jgi:hypothetical protein
MRVLILPSRPLQPSMSNFGLKPPMDFPVQVWDRWENPRYS